MATNKPASSSAYAAHAHHHRSPVKGILKTSKSFEKHETPGINKSTKFDEINVQLTHHPADKDYGHMKINEPKTPYHYSNDVNVDELDANLLAEKLEKTLTHSQFIDRSQDEDSDDDQIIETEEELQRRREFERRRKLHYNEFEAVMRARQLMEQDEEEDEKIEVDESSQSAN